MALLAKPDGAVRGDGQPVGLEKLRGAGRPAIARITEEAVAGDVLHRPTRERDAANAGSIALAPVEIASVDGQAHHHAEARGGRGPACARIAGVAVSRKGRDRSA